MLFKPNLLGLAASGARGTLNTLGPLGLRLGWLEGRPAVNRDTGPATQRIRAYRYPIWLPRGSNFVPNAIETEFLA